MIDSIKKTSHYPKSIYTKGLGQIFGRKKDLMEYLIEFFSLVVSLLIVLSIFKSG